VWFVIGLGFYAYLRRNKPAELENLSQNIASAHEDGAEPEAPVREPVGATARI
jgi:hypothetical protein